MSELHDHPNGGYRFLPGIPAFSEGIVAMPDHGIVHARSHGPVDLADGYDLIERVLAEHGRPLAALCGVELRIPVQMELDAFRALNRAYIEHMRDRWGLFVDGINPVPRCNHALTTDPVPTPAVHAFSFTVPERRERPHFVTAGINDAALIYGEDVFANVAGGGELVRVADAPTAKDVSSGVVERRLRFILERADARLKALGVGWRDTTQVELYLGRPLGDLLERVVLPAIGPAGRAGVRWFAGLAPFVGPEAEMDVRGFAREIVVDHAPRRAA